MKTTTQGSKYFMDLEDQYGAHNYHPLPVVLSQAEGVWVWDPEGQQVHGLPCPSYSAVNQGHRHPKVVSRAHRAGGQASHSPAAPSTTTCSGRTSKKLTEDRADGRGAPDEHGRRGGRDGDQDRAQVGLREERRVAAEQSGDHRVRGELSRPHHDHRRFLHRPRRPRRLRPRHAGLQDHSVQR